MAMHFSDERLRLGNLYKVAVSSLEGNATDEVCLVTWRHGWVEGFSSVYLPPSPKGASGDRFLYAATEKN